VREDVALCMPLFPLWLRGPEAVAAFMLGPGAHCRGSRLVRVGANGAPAFGQYHRDEEGWRAWSLIVLEVRGGRIATIHHFLDTERLFPRFGLAMRLPA
jgi:RNA polymerase sigma-70 factor (ECF subfamily)